jgi:uncharacterized membrane protein HdeD (DUF308 family)
MIDFGFRKYGLLVTIFGTLALIASEYFDWRPTLLEGSAAFESEFQSLPNYIDEVGLTLLIAGLLLIMMAREKVEDEFIHSLRLHSLMLAMVVYYVVLIACVWLLYDFEFLHFALYNLFTPLIFYILYFRIRLNFNMKD